MFKTSSLTDTQRDGPLIATFDVAVLQPTAVITCSLALLLGAASMLMMGADADILGFPMRMFRHALIALSATSILFAGLFYSKPLLPFGCWRLLGVWFVFGVTCIISSIANGDALYSVASTAWLAVGVPLVFFIGLPGVLGDNATSVLLRAFEIGHVPFVAISLLMVPRLTFPYKGIMGHPNAMGVVGSALFACALIRSSSPIYRGVRELFRSVAYAACALLSLGLVAVSGSRTSAAACFVALVSALLFSLTTGRFRHFLSRMTLIGCLAAPCAYMYPDAYQAFDSLIAKHSSKLLEGDMLSKRDTIWQQTIDEMRLLGNGGEYFEDYVGLSAHNSFVHVLGQRGPIAASLLLVFALTSIIMTIQYSLGYGSEDPLAHAPGVLTLVFWTLSIGEGMFGSLGNGFTMCCLLAAGIAGSAVRHGTAAAAVPDVEAPDLSAVQSSSGEAKSMNHPTDFYQLQLGGHACPPESLSRVDPLHDISGL